MNQVTTIMFTGSTKAPINLEPCYVLDKGAYRSMCDYTLRITQSQFKK
jgi:hypothetical protein